MRSMCPSTLLCRSSLSDAFLHIEAGFSTQPNAVLKDSSEGSLPKDGSMSTGLKIFLVVTGLVLDHLLTVCVCEEVRGGLQERL